MAGARPAVEERTHWVIYDDGSTGLLTVTCEDEPALARPGRFVSEAEYKKAHRALRIAVAEYVHSLAVEDEARTRRDFEALTSVGIPEATARRLSGYEGRGPGEVKP